MTGIPSPEPLETRIAAAAFFVSGTNLNITDSSGNNANDGASAAAAGATRAIVLGAGDTLFYDLNHDGDAVDAGGPAANAGSISSLTVLGSGLIGAPGSGYAQSAGLHTGLSTDPSKNGSVTNVVASAISFMIAGSPSAAGINAANAVKVIAGLNVKRIGADLNGDFAATDAAGSGPALAIPAR